MMSRRGFTIIAFLDAFSFAKKLSSSACAHALRILIYLLRKLGFSISWSKVVDPCQKLVFLGVEIDSTTLELRLPIKKLDELRRELASFQQRKHVSKKQLQSLAGKLNWASSVVHGGRDFLRRIIDSIMQLKHDRHKMRLGGDILHDIHWWYNFMATFNGKSVLLNTDPVTSVYTDACNTGAGGVFGTDWFYVNWKEDFPFAQSLHINEQEALAVALAVKRWAKRDTLTRESKSTENFKQPVKELEFETREEIPYPESEDETREEISDPIYSAEPLPHIKTSETIDTSQKEDRGIKDFEIPSIKGAESRNEEPEKTPKTIAVIQK
ncbi:unnamed protein product [Mytilus edulis]|uniref:Uncharacterized protein n=1 Tax=Mytilus edulis TaxID=6550 RepID=A0A8S3QEE5_MYTED|nr:unnamed protein product [Mytilus edulis]